MSYTRQKITRKRFIGGSRLRRDESRAGCPLLLGADSGELDKGAACIGLLRGAELLQAEVSRVRIVGF